MTNAPVYDGVAFSERLWTAPAYEADAERDRSEEIRAIWYTAYYKGEETKAFAYLGIPAGASAENPAPAVLLLHGGAGTAYYEWVEMWVNRGYVALAPDLEGHVPLESGRMSSAPAELYERSAYPAPQNKNYGDAALPLDETWMYYAASTAILGNSLLHSLDMVDRYKIGVCGVSWGGVVTSVVSGYDDRFAFSIPIYCSLNVGEEKGILGDAYRANPAALVWDDDRGLAARETPMLFYIANTDSVSACSASSVSETYEHCKNARMLIVDGLLHSQYHAATAVEPYFFADSIVKTAPRFPQSPSNRIKTERPSFTGATRRSRRRCGIRTPKLPKRRRNGLPAAVRSTALPSPIPSRRGRSTFISISTTAVSGSARAS